MASFNITNRHPKPLLRNDENRNATCVFPVKKADERNNGIINRTISSVSSSFLGGSIRHQSKAPQEPQVKPSDWLVVPERKPNDIINIDTDMESYLMCPSLAPAQYAYLQKIECRFMTEQGFLKKTQLSTRDRVNIVNWMTQVHRQYGDQQESLFLAINFFDRFLAARPQGSTIISQLPPVSMAQRVAATALYVSTKFEEIYAPSIDQICSATDVPRSTPPEIRRVEFDMLRALRFRVNPPLLNHFLRRCSKAAGATALLHSLGKYLIEVSYLNKLGLCNIAIC